MGNKPRLFEPNIVYNCVSRTVDRCFSFLPNQQKGNVLLANTCDADSLLANNDKIPHPSIINIFGSSLARAKQKKPVLLHYAECNINHLHNGISGVNEEQLGNISAFHQNAKRLIAEQVNNAWGRENHVFAGPYRTEPCLDNSAAEQKLIYSVTNIVNDGLLERVKNAPFFSTYEALANGKELKFWYIDWEEYWTKGGDKAFEKNKHHPKDYLKWITLELDPLPHLLDVKESLRQSWFRKQVKAVEEQKLKERQAENKPVIGKDNLRKLNPRDRPKNPKKSGPQPLCHAGDVETKITFKAKWKAFRKEHKKASIDFRNGQWEREFPDGSFRPPIKNIYFASQM